MSAVTNPTELAAERVRMFAERVQAIGQSLRQVVVGQDDTIDLLLACLPGIAGDC